MPFFVVACVGLSTNVTTENEAELCCFFSNPLAYCVTCPNLLYIYRRLYIVSNKAEYQTTLCTFFMKYIHDVCFDRREQFVQWTEKLPDAQSPSWLGLPNNAEKLLLTVQGKNLTLKFFSIFSKKELNIKKSLK